VLLSVSETIAKDNNHLVDNQPTSHHFFQHRQSRLAGVRVQWLCRSQRLRFQVSVFLFFFPDT
jgi:hypothetical protein